MIGTSASLSTRCLARLISSWLAPPCCVDRMCVAGSAIDNSGARGNPPQTHSPTGAVRLRTAAMYP